MAKVDELKNKLQEEIERLDTVDAEELTDADLEEVAGGESICSYWCCSDQDTKEISAQ